MRLATAHAWCFWRRERERDPLPSVFGFVNTRHGDQWRTQEKGSSVEAQGVISIKVSIYTLMHHASGLRYPW